MVSKIITNVLVYLINITNNEQRIHRLSSKAFHRKYVIKSIDDKLEVQNRILSFKKLISDAIRPSDNLKRFGSKNDGGYLVFSKIDNGTNLVSCGIGSDTSFEFQIASQVKNVYMFDHTIDKVDGLSKNMFFFKKGVDVETSGLYTTLGDIIMKNDIKKSILKMDIEGMEWRILDSISLEFLTKFDQIIIELHNLFEISLSDRGDLYFRVIKKLTALFTIVNIHPNNWGEYRVLCGIPFVDTLELTMVNKNFVPKAPSNPVNLNSPNNPEEPDFVF
jgi:FkbM family methyltransferase